MANRKLQRAIHLTLGVASGALLATHMPVASAQDEIGAVVVTGSRIARADLESASPITVINRDQIEDQGFIDIGYLVQRMPSMSGSPIGTTTNNGGDGSVQVDLRGMGVNRTVTLVNGKRTVDGGDYQTIPAVMIERVEILKDGGASVYGADAVAGVVNIITRSNFDGLDISVQQADFFDMDSGAQQTVGLIGGKTFDGGHFTFGAEYVDQEEAFQRDAPWEFFQNSYYIYPAGCENQFFAPYDGTPTGGCYAGGSSRIEEGLLRTASQGVFMNTGSGLVPYDGRVYNYAPINYIQTPYKRTNMFLDGSYGLSDNVEFTGSVRGNFRQSEQLLAPQPYDSRLDPGYQGIFNGTPYNGISEDNFYLSQALAAAGLAPEPIIDARRRVSESNRSFTQDVTQIQASFGLNGDLGNDMHWDAYYNWGYRSQVDRDFGQFTGALLANALGPSADLDNNGTPECYGDIADPTTLIAGCVPMNLVGGLGTITQDMLDYVEAVLSDTRVTEQQEALASITGTWFELPGGKLGWAAGVAYTDTKFRYTPDSQKAKGTVTGNKGEGTRGSLIGNAFFAEFNAPVFDNGSQSLDVRGSVRYDSYTDFDSEVTYAGGVEFQAMDNLKLRATYGTVFRTPTITDLFGGQIDSFPTYTDPCATAPLPPGCAQAIVQVDAQLLARVGGNPLLQPETGDTLTAGLVWTPQVGSGNFSATVDYWQINIDEGISSLGVQFILDDCYRNQNAASCALVTRRADYSVATVINGSLNVSEQGAQGIDTELRYSWDTGIGQFEAAVLWAHLLERTKVPFAGAPEEDLSGRYTDPTAEDGGAYAADKINYSLKWNRNDLTIGYLGEYISSLDSVAFFIRDYPQKIDTQLYHDLLASYEFETGTGVAVGITNVTDEEPPYIDLGFNAKTDPSTYRMFGRGYYLRLTHKFK